MLHGPHNIVFLGIVYLQLRYSTRNHQLVLKIQKDPIHDGLDMFDERVFVLRGRIPDGISRLHIFKTQLTLEIELKDNLGRPQVEELWFLHPNNTKTIKK